MADLTFFKKNQRILTIISYVFLIIFTIVGLIHFHNDKFKDYKRTISVCIGIFVIISWILLMLVELSLINEENEN
jgi:uncharacterized membrane protein HdeD (DUF308 family)